MTSSPSRKPIEAIDSSGRGLRVWFDWRVDRFAHTIEQVDRGQLTPLIQSCEGTAQDDWPASPPLQSLTIEDRGGVGPVALLVGMAGTSHWSASVESNPAERSLTFDIACRLNQIPQALGTCYSLRDTSIIGVASRCIKLTTAAELVLERVDQQAKVRLGATDGRIMIAIEPSAETPAAQTVRWSYRLFLKN